MSDVHLKYINSVFVKVIAEPSIIMELSDHFTYFAEGYKFHPRYKARIWDGKIRLLNSLTGNIYAGLAQKIKKFCDNRNYSFSFDTELCYENISEYELKEFIDTLNIPSHFELRQYQFDSILKCIRSNRRLLVSPTSSGKSLMIYILTRWYGRKSLIIVPTIGLVKQMYGDFIDYGYTGTAQLSTNGLSKSNDIEEDIVITTWQSLNNGRTKIPKAWYKQFTNVIGDEAHGAKAKSLIDIFTSLESCKYRFGTTGTLDGNILNDVTIEGLFGPVYKATTTKELMDAGHVSKLKIKCIVLKYPEDQCKHVKDLDFPGEIDWLVNNTNRTKFIKNLVLSLKGNKLLFFRKRDHGQLFKEALEENVDKLFYIDGTIDANKREEIRHSIESENNCTLLASLGTSSTGISIKKMHHMIAGSPSKKQTKVLQSIGRLLRLHKTKEYAILYDIVDDLSYKTYKNYTLRHFIERTKIYDKEEFDYEIYYVKVK